MSSPLASQIQTRASATVIPRAITMFGSPAHTLSVDWASSNMLMTMPYGTMTN